MNQDVYVLSLGGPARCINHDLIYVGEHSCTYKLGDAKVFTSKLWLRLNKLICTDYRWWDITCHSRKTIFEAKLKGK